MLFEKSSGCVLHRDPNSGKCKVLLLGKWRQTVRQEDIPLDYVKVSDHLDMLGVVLKATVTQTRMVNGDEIVRKVKSKVGSWQGGRFMPLSQRPCSVNCYVFSMVYFRCNSIDLRVKDFNSITSSVKSWLYKDQFEKPEDIILYRPIELGGLGLDHLKSKANARLITSFLETAINPNFLHSLYHETIYRYHILEETSIGNPGLPSYLSLEIFDFIKSVYNEKRFNVSTMTSKQWYRELLDKTVLKELTDEGVFTLRKCRAELKNPGNDWGTSWYLARLKGLESDQISFLWRMLHDLLPTQSRISRILRLGDPVCKLCNVQEDDLPHLFDCRFTSTVCQALLKTVRTRCSDVSAKNILLLSLKLERSQEFSTIWFLSSIFIHVWEKRISKKPATIMETRAMLEAKVNLLRKSRRFQNEVISIENMLMDFH